MNEIETDDFSPSMSNNPENLFNNDGILKPLIESMPLV